jgi:predicted transcriptional regulator
MREHQPMTTTQGIKLDQETRKRLEMLAQKRDRSPHWLMCTAIKLYVEREEMIEREKREDLERWENYILTGKAISHEKTTAWLNKLAKSKAATCPK